MAHATEQMNIVIVGHVDHGKSTVIGRLLADTGSLPKGKLDQVKELCRRTAKPFEYAFLLDALKDEQAQGITIDAARCFFTTKKRRYMVFDAPGHVEFLKNMVSGAAHAEAAFLVIDAKEGIRENSRRHGYLLSMLGVRQVAILVNKMDLVGFNEEVFESIRRDYSAFLSEQGIVPSNFIPIAATTGLNIASGAAEMPWYKGKTVIEQLEAFENKIPPEGMPFRFSVQDIYKFTEGGDDRRILAGTVVSGSISSGEEVIFLPSRKRARIKTVERFNAPADPLVKAGEAIGFTFDTEAYVKPGEIMVRASDGSLKIDTRFRANIFWMGKTPLIKGKNYKLKLASARVRANLVEIVRVVDASELTSTKGKSEVARHDVAEVILETAKPIAFDIIAENEDTGRFVLVDDYEIAGGGIVLEAMRSEDSLLKESIRQREHYWSRGAVTPEDRAERYGHKPKFVVISGPVDTGKRTIADALEHRLVTSGCAAYYLGISNIMRGLVTDLEPLRVEEDIRRLGELAHIMTDAGFIFITTISDADGDDIDKLKLLNAPAEIIVASVGGNGFGGFKPDIEIPSGQDIAVSVDALISMLKGKKIIAPDYII